MSGVRSSHQDVDIDIGRLFLAVWERRGRVLLATVAVTGLAFVGTSLIKPDYQSETRVLIELRDTNMSKNDSGASASQPQLDDLGIASQVQLMKSVDLIKTVARDMKLYDLKEFNSSQSSMTNLLAKLGLSKSNADLPPEEQVLDAFNKKLEVYQVEKSRVIGIQFTSKDPKLAAAIPNKIADVFLSLQSGAKLDNNSETSKWLEPEIADLRKKVEDAEAKVADFRRSSDLLPTSKESSFADQQLNDISAELTKVRSEQATSQARAQSVKSALASGAPVDTLTEVMASPSIQKLKETETTIMARISDLSITLMDGHPQLKGLKAQLAGVRTQIRDESQKIASSLQNEANIGKERERELLAQLKVLKEQSANAGEKSVTLKALEREATAQRDLLESYLAKYRQANSRTAENATPADARVVSNATEPTEVFFPKKIPIMIVAAVGTLVVSSIIIMLSELFTGRALQPVSTGVATRRPEDEIPQPAAAVAPSPRVEQPAVSPVAKPMEATAVVHPGGEVEKNSLLGRLFSNPLSAIAGSGMAAAAEIENRPSSAPATKTAVEPVATLPSEVEFQPSSVKVRQEPKQENKYSVARVAQYLVASKVPVVVSLAPTGDKGSLATVMLSRVTVERGLKTIVIDVSGTGCATRLMSESKGLPGLTDLLTGQSTIAGSIHADRLSDANLIPTGNSDFDEALASFDRLPMIADALSGAYDLVMVDVGALDFDRVARLVRNMNAELILSVPDDHTYDVDLALSDLSDAGCEEVIMLKMRDDDKQQAKGQQAA